MNRRIFVIQVFSGLVYQTVQTFLVTGIRRREDGEKTITNDGGSYGFGRGSRAALTKVDKTKLTVTEVDSQNVLTIPSKVDDEYTVTELGDNLFCMVYEVGEDEEGADSAQTGETDSDQTEDKKITI